ncbi:MAG: response regulator, partial [Ilumatobacteraceae bacterium]|nr:response regulator [Ilumatobacteraceae bacterium]
VQLMRSTLPASVALRVNIDPQPIAARADASQIGQVLMNLCTNAWHASAGAAARIEIGLDRRVVVRDEHNSTDGLPPGDYAHLWVADDGKGMDAATRERMFEPFFTTKPVGQGTGLGLSVVHGIVMAHQGAITVDSELGRGTSVHVLLPLRQLLPQQSGLISEVTETATGRGQQVLYVDDDEVMLLMVERLLQRAGYRVTVLQDGESAITALRERPQDFDVVLSDFNMPGMTGLQFARHVLQLRADLPVVLISGDVSDELRVEAAAIGVAALVPKQDAFDQLAAIVHRLCGGDSEPGAVNDGRGFTSVAAEESQRLSRVRDLIVLDTEPEPVFDAIAKLASDICGVPIALLSLVDEERQWFKANVGLAGVSETQRDGGFCDHAIDDDALFQVPDATKDDRFANHPLVTGAPGIRFYAGAPLILPGGERIGTLCVIDRQIRHLSPSQTKGLRLLATIATQGLLMRRDLVRKALAVRTQESRMQENLASRLGPSTVF